MEAVIAVIISAVNTAVRILQWTEDIAVHTRRRHMQAARRLLPIRRRIKPAQYPDAAGAQSGEAHIVTAINVNTAAAKTMDRIMVIATVM